MLDKPDFIARYDRQDVLGVNSEMPKQLGHEFPEVELGDVKGITSIVLAGMGGSAQPGEFINTWLGSRLPVPFIIVRDYALPAHVGAGSLVIVSSYSGNTEETLATFAEAKERGARMAVLAGGGKLLELAKQEKLPYFELPKALQPRMGVLYAVRALAQLFETAGLADGLLDDLAEAGKWLAGEVGDWAGTVPTEKNVAKQIANDIVGHACVVYAGPTLAFAAMKLKIAFNENAKNIAFYNMFPELNHNEFIGWLHPERSGLKVIELTSDLDHPQVKKRIEVTNRLLSSAFSPIVVKAKGEGQLKQLVWTIVLGEYIATYLALLNGIDPAPVDLVEKLKVELVK
jgi:glucose/mannose-6-phosphate isomerase